MIILIFIVVFNERLEVSLKKTIQEFQILDKTREELEKSLELEQENQNNLQIMMEEGKLILITKHFIDFNNPQS